MKIKRRDLLFASGLSLLAVKRAFGQEQSQTPNNPAARLLEALQRNRLPLTMNDSPAERGCAAAAEANDRHKLC
jgi:hypothetical protein